MILHRARPILAGVLLLAAPACFSPSAPVVYHTLNAVPPREAGPASSLAVEVLPVSLPEVLQRPQIVVLAGARGLELTPGHRWGNPLEKDMQRILVANLSALLGSDRIVASPQGSRVKAAYRVHVDVERCEGKPGGILTFQAAWMIFRPADDAALVLRRTSLEEPVRGRAVEDLVAAHDQALADISREIAQGLKSVPR